MNKTNRSQIIRFREAEARIPGPPDAHAISLFQHGTLAIKLSLPVGPNRQTPHEQDEVYIIARGSGFFVHDGKRDAIESGDAMFVAAGTEHHFEDFTKDFAVWVLFYGPSGGEVHH